MSLSKTLLLTVALTALAAPAFAETTPATPTVAASDTAAPHPYHLGAYADMDVALMVAMKQAAAIAGGVVWGPFRAGLGYETFLSNTAFGGVPDGFSMRVNYILSLNAAYFIGRHSDDGLYVQGMFHIKQQGITNEATGAHRGLDSLAAGLELGYLWKVWKGLYVAPRVGALFYLKKPQGSDNQPILIGDRLYDNDRHKTWDTYFIPTLSVGYSW